MPINALQKNHPRGKCPPVNASSAEKSDSDSSPEEQLKETDLAAKEELDLWESQEIGITRWSESDGKRYSD